MRKFSSFFASKEAPKKSSIPLEYLEQLNHTRTPSEIAVHVRDMIGSLFPSLSHKIDERLIYSITSDLEHNLRQGISLTETEIAKAVYEATALSEIRSLENVLLTRWAIKLLEASSNNKKPSAGGKKDPASYGNIPGFGNVPGMARKEQPMTMAMQMPKIPKDLLKIIEAFQNPNLENLQHDLARPEADKNVLGKDLADLPLEVRQKLKVMGNGIYVVGGAVDAMMSHHFHQEDFSPKDYDLTTDAHPEIVKLILERANEDKIFEPPVKIDEVGKSFGVILVTFPPDPESDNPEYKKVRNYEIATFRQDSATGDGRRPEFVTFSDMATDAKRRDDARRSVFWDPIKGQLIDYTGGIAAAQNDEARMVGEPDERLGEDKLRALRHARFHAMTGKGTHDNLRPKELSAIKKMKLRPEVSEDRIQDEFKKGIGRSRDASNYLKVLDALGLLDQVFHGISVNKEAKIPQGAKNPVVVMASLLSHASPSQIERALGKLRYSNDDVDGIKFLVNLPNYTEDNLEEFHRDRQKSRKTLKPSEIMQYIELNKLKNKDLLKKMFQFQYPSVKIDPDEMNARGLTGSAIGAHKKQLEKENFKNFTL